MKVYIRQNATTKTGYELVSIDELGNEVVQEIEKTYPNEPYTLVLPSNESNRKYFNSKKVEAAGGEIELTYKESKTLGPRENGSPRKKLEDYLTDEEKSIIANIMAEAKKRKEADKPKPLTELEKAQREYEKAKARWEKLTGAQA
jgi:hypothetical protein